MGLGNKAVVTLGTDYDNASNLYEGGRKEPSECMAKLSNKMSELISDTNNMKTEINNAKQKLNKAIFEKTAELDNLKKKMAQAEKDLQEAINNQGTITPIKGMPNH